MKPTILPLESLRKITDDFSEDRIIGVGGFGRVYKVIKFNFFFWKFLFILNTYKDINLSTKAEYLVRMWCVPNFLLLSLLFV